MIPGEGKIKTFLRRFDANTLMPLLIYKYKQHGIQQLNKFKEDELEDGDIKVDSPRGSIGHGKKTTSQTNVNLYTD